jgi:hypothetical protein
MARPTGPNHTHHTSPHQTSQEDEEVDRKKSTSKGEITIVARRSTDEKEKEGAK